MTQEQIKQNAEAYAKAHTPLDNWESDKVLARNAYIAGAHSLSDEVSRLETINKALRKELKTNDWERRNLAEICSSQTDEIAKLKDELAKTKNPWVSVEERLPEKMPKSDYSKVVLIKYEEGDICKARYCHQGYAAPRWEHWQYGSGIPTPKYWMSIPEGGEE